MASRKRNVLGKRSSGSAEQVVVIVTKITTRDGFAVWLSLMVCMHVHEGFSGVLGFENGWPCIHSASSHSLC